jgi:phosphatidate cytidylyltransferase
LKTRIITALIFGVIMIGATMLMPETSAILYVIVGLLCVWEFSGLVLAKDSKPFYNNFRRIFAVAIAVIPSLLVLDAMLSPNPIARSGYVQWFFPMVFIPFIFELRAGSSKPFENIGFTYAGIIYIGVPSALLTAISLQDSTGRFIIMAVMLLIWANDVFAYFIGKFMGKHKIFPSISPNKTWEGTIGGFISAILWGIVSYFIWGVIGYEIWHWMVLGAICSVFGIIGDLVASKLKRSLNIKDTGTILPGHGGLLDRFDAFIFATPFVVFTICYVFMDSRFQIW